MYSVFLDWVFIEDNSKELNQFITAMNKTRKDLYFTILVPSKSHFTRLLDQFDNVEYVKDVENRFEEPGKEISAMPYISKYICVVFFCNILVSYNSSISKYVRVNIMGVPIH